MLNFQMKSPCYLVTLSLESSDFQTFLKQYVILVPFGALIYIDNDMLCVVCCVYSLESLDEAILMRAQYILSC